eukprot:8755166-Lingulodinium_polyedra.AAC.1
MEMHTLQMAVEPRAPDPWAYNDQGPESAQPGEEDQIMELARGQAHTSTRDGAALEEEIAQAEVD